MAYVIDQDILNKYREVPKIKEKYWVSYVRQRIANNKNFLGFISGQTGSGKSYSSLRICEDLDPHFNIERVVFSGLEMMNLINSNKLKRGSAICFEEVGVEMNTKNWASVTNKMLNYLIQTFRHKGFILILNSPFMDFVDSSTRKLFHAEMATRGIDYQTSEVLLKPVLIQYNSRQQKFYYKRLRVITTKGKLPIDIWKVGLPSDELRKAYEQKKHDYTSKLNFKIQRELEEIENKGTSKYELTEIQSEVLESLKEGMNVEQIAKQRNRATTSINLTMNLLKKKKYEFKPIYSYDNGRRVVKYEVIEPKTGVEVYKPPTHAYKSNSEVTPMKTNQKAMPPIPKGATNIKEGDLIE